MKVPNAPPPKKNFRVRDDFILEIKQFLLKYRINIDYSPFIRLSSYVLVKNYFRKKITFKARNNAINFMLCSQRMSISPLKKCILLVLMSSSKICMKISSTQVILCIYWCRVSCQKKIHFQRLLVFIFSSINS